MIKSLWCLLLFSSFTYASPPAISFIQDNELITVKGQQTDYGYGYNLDADEVLRLVTLNWPPYIDESLCDFGWVFQVTVEMLISQGYGVDVEFYPWARAVREAELGKADILFPEYFIDDSAKSDNVPNKTRNEVLALSAPIPGGDLSLITLKDNNIQYDGSLNSIKNEVISVVRAYKNTIELDKLIDNNQIATIVVNNEFQLARLLLSKRVTLIVADLDSLLASVDKSPMSANQKQIINSSLVALKPSLEYKYLHYSVSKKKANWRSILQAIDSKIETMNKERTFEQQIKESSRRCK